jgi:hypothetical protein
MADDKTLEELVAEAQTLAQARELILGLFDMVEALAIALGFIEPEILRRFAIGLMAEEQLGARHDYSKLRLELVRAMRQHLAVSLQSILQDQPAPAKASSGRRPLPPAR